MGQAIGAITSGVGVLLNISTTIWNVVANMTGIAAVFANTVGPHAPRQGAMESTHTVFPPSAATAASSKVTPLDTGTNQEHNDCS
jgi:hypothetical protein